MVSNEQPRYLPSIIAEIFNILKSKERSKAIHCLVEDTDPFQEQLDFAKEGELWADMKKLYHLD